MNAKIALLRAQIAADRASIRKRLTTVAEKSAPRTDEEGDHLALNAHRVYAALKSILERVAKTLEGGLPGGATWHQELLDNAFLDVAGVRPAVLSTELLEPIRQLRGFRHFVRHAYDADLDLTLLADRRLALIAMAPELERSLDAFDAYLADLS